MILLRLLRKLTKSNDSTGTLKWSKASSSGASGAGWAFVSCSLSVTSSIMLMGNVGSLYCPSALLSNVGTPSVLELK